MIAGFPGPALYIQAKPVPSNNSTGFALWERESTTMPALREGSHKVALKTQVVDCSWVTQADPGQISGAETIRLPHPAYHRVGG